MRELKPCPFCGGDESGEELHVVSWDSVFYVQCDACFSTGPEYHDDESARNAWNTRPESKSE